MTHAERNDRIALMEGRQNRQIVETETTDGGKRYAVINSNELGDAMFYDTFAEALNAAKNQGCQQCQHSNAVGRGKYDRLYCGLVKDGGGAKRPVDSDDLPRPEWCPKLKEQQ